MKTKYFILIILLFTSVKVFSQKDSLNKNIAYPLKVTLEDIDKHTSNYSRDIFHKLRIKITNKADTSFSFWLMTCSWHGCINFNPDIVYSDFTGCDRNFPEEITLKPDSSFFLDAGYKLDSLIKNSVVKLSVGLRVIKLPYHNILEFLNADLADGNEKKIKDFIDQFHDDPEYPKKDYIWSKPISIKFQ
ncbi:hypothetical protein [Ferruginibacter sp.]|nr:hypothetical protein [Ferruginibacter sp.]